MTERDLMDGPRTSISADDVITLLGLEPLPFEGGAFRETYRAGLVVRVDARGGGGGGTSAVNRNASTQIYYLLRSGETSALHRVRHDEVFHHYLGDPVVQLLVSPSGSGGGDGGGVGSTRVIGPDLAAGERPQAVVHGEWWQGACLKSDSDGGGAGRGWALMGCTVSPGFDWADFDLITADEAEALAGRMVAGDGEDPARLRELVRRLTPAEGRTRA